MMSNNEGFKIEIHTTNQRRRAVVREIGSEKCTTHTTNRAVQRGGLLYQMFPSNQFRQSLWRCSHLEKRVLEQLTGCCSLLRIVCECSTEEVLEAWGRLDEENNGTDETCVLKLHYYTLPIHPAQNYSGTCDAVVRL